jgi:fatty acid desaturase
MYVEPFPPGIRHDEINLSRRAPSPREAMAERLPAALQPFLTWLTAKPAPGEVPVERPGTTFVWAALGWIAAGIALTLLPFLAEAPPTPLWAAVPLGLLFTCCGLGLFQVVVFHHCSHGTVFRTRDANRRAGRLVSALLLFKRFEDYQREHMIHHSANKLLTEEDEFTDFVLGLCALEPGLPKEELWRRVLVACISPAFHWRFLQRRIQKSLFTGDAGHDWTGRIFWGGAIALALATDTFGLFLVAWVLPVTVLLQIATIGRIIVEHSFPPAEVIRARGRELVREASVGVFPGTAPPDAPGLRGVVAWAGWWTEMLTWQLFVRLFIMVGDAPCHDYHHRKPATRKWTAYIQARQQDVETGTGSTDAYHECWGLVRAVDRNLASLAATAPETLGRRATATQDVAEGMADAAMA